MKESKPIEGSPFIAHRYDEFWIITVGKYRTQNKYKTFEEAVEAVNSPTWELLMLVMQTITEANKL